jgi:dGTPase
MQERFGREFRHYEHSLRVVDVLERDGAGLNLNDDVRDGIRCHSGRAPLPRTLEGRIVRIVDRVAYINHDIDDAVRAGVIASGGLPAGPIAVLGATGSARIDALVHDLVEHSAAGADIVQGAAAGAAMDELRTWMFETVYLGPVARTEHARIERVLQTLFNHYAADPGAIPDHGGAPGADDGQRVVDYLAGMTDRYCIRMFEALTVPESFAA